MLSYLTLGAATVLTPKILLSFSVSVGLTKDANDYSFEVQLPIRFDLFKR